MRHFAILPFLTIPALASADVPGVVTDIAPVHSLVASVMGDVGSPQLLLDGAYSPHDYALRPSDARALGDADVVFWIGEELEPWLGDVLDTLAVDTQSIELIDAPAAVTHGFRDAVLFDDDHEDEHGHDHEDGHDHSGIDPHAWLNPDNAIQWLGLIAATLAEADPDNADAYADNAKDARAQIEQLSDGIAARMTPLSEMRYVVFHDAYRYFEERYGLAPLGAISLGDASAPSPSRIATLRDAVSEAGVTCVFSEPQYNAGLVRSIAGDDVQAAVIDPLGADIAAGPDYYANLMESIAAAFETCR